MQVAGASVGASLGIKEMEEGAGEGGIASAPILRLASLNPRVNGQLFPHNP